MNKSLISNAAPCWQILRKQQSESCRRQAAETSNPLHVEPGCCSSSGCYSHASLAEGGTLTEGEGLQAERQTSWDNYEYNVVSPRRPWRFEEIDGKRDWRDNSTLTRILGLFFKKYRSGTNACRTFGDSQAPNWEKSTKLTFYHTFYAKQNRRSLLFPALVDQSPSCKITSFRNWSTRLNPKTRGTPKFKLWPPWLS